MIPTLPIESPFRAYLPLIGPYLEHSSTSEIETIRKDDFSTNKESIEKAYKFMATHLHSGKIQRALTEEVQKIEDPKFLKNCLMDLLIEDGHAYLKCLDIFPEKDIEKVLQEAKDFAENLPKEFCRETSLARRTTSTLILFLRNIMHVFQMTFRLDTQEQNLSIYDASYLLDIYIKYLTIPVFIASKLAECFLNWQTIFLATIVVHVALGVALFVYNRYFKSAPRSIPGGINLNEALFDGRMSSTAENKGGLKRLKKMLQAPSKESAIHPFLIGNSGSGKTSLAISYAQKQLRRKENGKEHKTVYIVKTADIVHAYVKFSEQIKRIAQLLEGEKVVIFFEEFDATMDTDKKLYKNLYSLRDDLNVICIPVMTLKGFEALKNEPEFFRRFVPLKMEGQAGTDQAVRYFHRAYLGDVHVTEEAMQQLAKCPQPSDAITKLVHACRLVTLKEKMGANAKLIEDKETELGILKEKFASVGSLENEKVVKSKKEEIVKLEKKYDVHRETWEKIRLLSKRRFEYNSIMNKLARELKKNVYSLAELNRKVNSFHFLRHRLLPNIKEKLDEALKNIQPSPENYIPSYVDVPLLSMEK